MALTDGALIKVNGAPAAGEQSMADAGTIVTTVGSPGSDSSFPTEQAVREAITALTTGNITESTDARFVTDAQLAVISNTSNTNTGDQDLSGLAPKSNVLELDNTNVFTPDADYEPATKKYVDDNAGTLPLTTKGDLAGFSTVAARLPVGTDTQVLTADSAQALGVKWATPTSGGMTDPMTTRGDIIIKDAANATARLPIGTNGQVLGSNGTDVDWTTQSAANVSIAGIGTPDYTTVQALSNGVQSAGILDGGIITDAGAGAVDISAMNGVFKTTDSDVGANVTFKLGQQLTIALTDNVTNYIEVDYNSGTPQLVVGTTSTDNGHTIFEVGRVFREGTSLDIINGGNRIYDLFRRVHEHETSLYELHFTSGAIVGATGTRQITITTGLLWSGLNPLETDAINTATGDTFEYYYYNGSAWIESDQTTIDNTQYNNIASGLATLSNNQYGVHWVFKGTNGTTFVIYGQGSYTLLEAQTASIPASLPSHVANFGVLRAKIIISKNATAFTEIQQVQDVSFQSTTPSDHNVLANLQGGTTDQYYHLTSAQATVVGNTSNTNTGDQTSIVGISGTLSQFNTAISDADVAKATNITEINKLTQSAYDGLTPDASTIYFIVG